MLRDRSWRKPRRFWRRSETFHSGLRTRNAGGISREQYISRIYQYGWTLNQPLSSDGERVRQGPIKASALSTIALNSKPLDLGVSRSMQDYMADKAKENWRSGGPYEQYVGRWSRKVARDFLAWLQVSPGQTWGDVGCGTGALVDTILAGFDPKSIVAIDRSEGFIAEARRTIDDSRVRFRSAMPRCFPGRADHAM